eukprot:TRINITY_DN25713_c0_g1_i1.p1 TRINITY_DN25713_c0_g1~~TRINITY_DN25713_c0_g1_i1.p1  ORF type:complete len:197 (+),score=79.75 TRINITY_DN25713_c0_g1_i1:53-592(+)
MPPKKAEPDPEPEELTPEELEARAKALEQKTWELSSLEACGRRTVAELEVVAWRFIGIQKARTGGDEAEAGDVYGASVYVYVRLLTGNRAMQGETLELVCKKTDTADFVKKLIEEEYGALKPLPAHQQLTYKGREFAGGESLEGAGILPNATLHLQITGWAAEAPPPVRVQGRYAPGKA